AAESFWFTPTPIETKVSATSATTKTMPATQAYRSHALDVCFSITSPSSFLASLLGCPSEVSTRPGGWQAREAPGTRKLGPLAYRDGGGSETRLRPVPCAGALGTGRVPLAVNWRLRAG